MFTMLININVYNNINQFNQRDWIAKENLNLCCLHAVFEPNSAVTNNYYVFCLVLFEFTTY